jgi:hypothetical protein
MAEPYVCARMSFPDKLKEARVVKNAFLMDINTRSYLTGDTLHLCCRVQPVNVM